MKTENSFNRNKIEVFITDLHNGLQARQSLVKLEKRFPNLKINFDLNESDGPYPCYHTVLRVQGKQIESEQITREITELGFKCDRLEDKVCY